MLTGDYYLNEITTSNSRRHHFPSILNVFHPILGEGLDETTKASIFSSSSEIDPNSNKGNKTDNDQYEDGMMEASSSILVKEKELNAATTSQVRNNNVDGTKTTNNDNNNNNNNNGLDDDGDAADLEQDDAGQDETLNEDEAQRKEFDNATFAADERALSYGYWDIDNRLDHISSNTKTYKNVNQIELIERWTQNRQIAKAIGFTQLTEKNEKHVNKIKSTVRKVACGLTLLKSFLCLAVMLPVTIPMLSSFPGFASQICLFLYLFSTQWSNLTTCNFGTWRISSLTLSRYIM